MFIVKITLDILIAVCYNIIVPRGTIKRKEGKPMGKKKKRAKVRMEAIKTIAALISSVAALIAAIAALLKD